VDADTRRTMSNLRHAIKVLEHGRQTHAVWIEYLKETPDFDTELVGDIEHHEWYLTGYDPAIEALKGLVDAALTGDTE